MPADITQNVCSDALTSSELHLDNNAIKKGPRVAKAWVQSCALTA